jgi:O-antigen/teichoic acid export membrane protein
LITLNADLLQPEKFISFVSNGLVNAAGQLLQAFSVVLISMGLPYYYYVIYMNRVTENAQRMIIRISLVSVVANLILSFVLINAMDVLGALLANAITQWGILIFHVFVIEQSKSTQISKV